jgi:uncharacterized membrane protein
MGEILLSFESYRLMGLVSTLLMVLVPIVVGIASGSLLLSNISVDVNIYWLIANIIIQIVVLIVFLGAMSGFAKYYDDSKIYQNSLYVVILGILAVIITPIFTHVTNSLIPTFLNFVFGMVFLAVFGILTGFFYREAFHPLAKKSGEINFKHAGWLMFIGGILTVIVIGVFVVLLGRMFAFYGFFSMKRKVK